MKKYLLLCLLVSSLCSMTRASHIFGGYLTLTQTDVNQGKFLISLNIYVDMITTGSIEQTFLETTTFNVKVFRKSDNVEMMSIDLPYSKSTDFVYDNAGCSQLKNLKTKSFRYQDVVNFNLSDFNNSGGYYLAWTRCCRNASIINIKQPNNTGLTLYLEFPALQEGGNPISYSSPEFKLPNGTFICRGQAFQLQIGVENKSNAIDVFKYKIVTPFGSQNSGFSYDDPIRAAPYPLITWESGYSDLTTIKGSPSLSIDENTGILSVTAKSIGVYVLTIQCEQYRNGIKIGVVRQDLQLPVVDCSTNIPTKPTITYQGNPIKTIDYCNGSAIVLTADNSDTNWSFQWQKDGVNVQGANTNALSVTEKGMYSVIKSYKNICVGISPSDEVIVKEPVDIKIQASKTTFCENESAILTAIVGTNTTFEWQYNGISLGTDIGVITVNKAGTYFLKGHLIGSSCSKQASQVITVNPIPSNLVSPSPSPVSFCEKDSIKVSVLNNPAYTYQWFLNNNPITRNGNGNEYWIAQAGIYHVKIADTQLNCQNTSNNMSFATLPLPPIRFDSITSICPTVQPIVSLTAQPYNGIFEWNSNPITSFDAASVGAGRYVIKFSYNDGQCTARQNRVIEVQQSNCTNIPSLTNHLIFPTAFTPNNDGINDVWEVFGISQYPDAQLWIYDRWGTPIYYDKGNNISWNGINGNNTLPEGIYTYRLLPEQNSNQQYTGGISIIK